jgi:hypothetical protein
MHSLITYNIIILYINDFHLEYTTCFAVSHICELFFNACFLPAPNRKANFKMHIFENKLHSAGMVRGEIMKSAGITHYTRVLGKKCYIGLPLAFTSQSGLHSTGPFDWAVINQSTFIIAYHLS